MKKGLILLADGFEQVEALAFLDVLNRGGIKCDLVSISKSFEVCSSSNVTVKADKLIDEINADGNDYDFIYLPGGKVGVDNLGASLKVKYLITNFYNNNKLIVAICAAPSILCEMRILSDKKYTCFPGFNSGSGEYLKDETTVVDKNIITGRSMYYSIELAEKVLFYYLGEQGVKKVYPGTRGIE